MPPLAPTPAQNGTAKTFIRRLFLLFLVAIFLSTSISARGAASIQDQPPQALGSLSKVGEVYVNDIPVTAAESTIFNGDKLRTGDDGVASFAVSGRGTLKFSPNTFVVFADSDQYVADLRSGTVVMSSFSGPSGLAVRVGDFIVVPAVQEQQTTGKIERAVAGDAGITCLEGSMSVVSLHGAAGLFLQAGQTSAISESGRLGTESAGARSTNPPEAKNPEPPKPAEPQPGPTTAPNSTTSQNKSHKGWIILGLAGAGVAGIAAAAAGGGGGHQPISPSAP
jgi:hypothetical protein